MSTYFHGSLLLFTHEKQFAIRPIITDEVSTLKCHLQEDTSNACNIHKHWPILSSFCDFAHFLVLTKRSRDN